MEVNDDGKEGYGIKAAEKAEVLYQRVQQMQDLRPSSRLSPQVRHLPYLLP